MAAYYLSPTRKRALQAQTRRRRLRIPLHQRVARFKMKKQMRDKADLFQRRNGSKAGIRNSSFTYKDVLAKFGDAPVCYLTGVAVDWQRPETFVFDHVVPATRGGENCLENLGLLSPLANKMKSDLTVQEFLTVCQQVLQHYGFTVTAPWQNSNAPVSKTECG